MSKGKGEVKTRRSDKIYTAKEYNCLFNLHVMGLKVHEIARILERQPDAVRRGFDRMCVNGTNYRNKRLYGVKPWSTGFLRRFSGPVKKYIKAQWTIVKVKPSLEELSARLNIGEEDLSDFIQKNEKYWKKPQENKLF